MVTLNNHLATLDTALSKGIADADAGRTTPAEEVFDRLEAKYKAMAEVKSLAASGERGGGKPHPTLP